MSAIDELWAVATRGGPVDARRLLDALAAIDPRDVEVADERTRILCRDAGAAVRNFRATDPSFSRRANALPAFPPPEPDPMDRGFRTLEARLMEPTDPALLHEMLRDLGRRVREPCAITIGGSFTLMLDRLIVRRTDDVDVVDELPPAIRDQHDLLDQLARRYGIRIGHFQSHYLPRGWQRRVRSLGVFGSITASRVDPIDVLVCKLFSRREKDFDDVRLALPLVGREAFVDRVATSTGPWRAIPNMLETATRNWYVLTGEESLPPARGE